MDSSDIQKSQKFNIPQYQTIQFYCVISIVILITVISIVISCLTAFIWLPLFLLNIPTIVIFACLIKYTPLKKPVNNYFSNLYDWLFYKSESTRKYIWGFIYNSMCLLYPQTHWKAMNYGYAVVNKDGRLIKNLKQEDEEERFCLQLYHYIATKLGKLRNLNGLDIIEVGCGRGGGLNYLKNYLNPKSVTGIDLSENQIRFCKATYDNIDFFKGDAEQLEQISQLKDKEQAYDLLINIESSHCYGNFESFLEQSHKYVKPNGYLLFTDFRNKQGLEELQDIFKNQSEKWQIEEEEDITINVIKSLKLDEERRLDIINNNVSQFIQPLFKKICGIEGTKINQEFQNKQSQYFAYILKRI